MGDGELGRVLDPKALDEGTGPRARLRIDVPAAWLREPSRLEIKVPRRVPCARCNGGGCDGCARSGVLRAPKDEGARTIVTSLPRAEGDGLALRLSDPFGPEAGVSQLILEVHASGVTTPGVSLLRPDPVAERPVSIPTWAIAATLAAVAAALAAIFSR